MLSKLILDFNNFSFIKKDYFNGLGSLRYLSFSNNKIQKIEDFSFQNCAKLVLIDLEYNRINDIQINTFSNLSSLKFLFLSNNLISKVENGSFQDLKSLSRVYLDSNNLSQIPSFNDRLEILAIEKNFLQKIDNKIFNISINMTILILKKNQIVITCCASGMRSASAKNILLKNGFKEVHNGGSWSGLERKL